MWEIEVKHGALFPQDERGALGLLFGVDSDDGERVTLVVDPEWLRMLLEGIENGHELGRLPVPPEVSLPIAARGWDDDWEDDERQEMGHMHWLFREAGWDWELLKKVVDVLQGFEEHP